MMAACAVTGATGYVGSRLAAHLQRVFDVIPLSRKPVANGIRWAFNADESIADALQQRAVKALVHAAWDFSADESVNAEGSRRLFAGARKANVERIVFISTISAFDGCRSHYGQSKLAVERMALDAGGIVIRPGLVWGNSPGGMFGSLQKQVAKGGIVPLIGNGRYPQYLVHEEDLSEVVLRALQGSIDMRSPLTAAHPQPWLFRDLIAGVARVEGKSIQLLPVPWPLIYGGLRLAETLGVKAPFRSDSVVSLVYQDPHPAFANSEQTGVALRPFSFL
jgi:nucleoside-diphosphate-sugar epimerase